VVALGCSLFGVVPSIVESADSPASVEVEVAGNGGYTVRRGDYLFGIARATGTDLSTLLSLNGLSLNSVIHPGQVLQTSGSTGDRGPATAPEWSGGTYTVQRGDYLFGIARATGTDLSTLLSLNGISLRAVIHPGQVLKTSGAGVATSGVTYTVLSGDCWSCIARKFGVSMGDLLAANGASTSTMIHPGQLIDLPAGATPAGGSSPASTPAAAQRPASSDPWLSAQLKDAVGAWRLDLAASLAGRSLRIVWDSSIPAGTDAVADSTMTIRMHPRLQGRSTRVLHNVLAHEFGHIMVIIAVERGVLGDPGVCHENAADEIASRIRERTVRFYWTFECTSDEARAIADEVFAQGF
jgi:LysM repeat protein